MTVEPGMVIRIYDEEAGKEKWHLVVGVSDDRVMLASLRLNSEVNGNVFRTDEDKAMNYKLRRKKNTFLGHTSHVNCKVLIEKQLSLFQDHIDNNPDEMKGFVHRNDFDAISGIMATSDLITGKQVRKYNLG